MDKRANDFSKGSVAGLILKQAIPLSVSSFAQILYNIVDRVYIGHLPGEGIVPLTGLGLTLPVVSIISAFTLLFGQGGAPYFSIARGQGNDKKAGRIMGNSAFLLIIGSILLTLLGYVFMRPLLFALGADEDSYVYASDYLRIYLAGTAFLVISTGLNFYITAQGFPKRSMAVILSGAVINMLLDPLFIFKFGMGIKGAAVATLISQTIPFVLVHYFLTGNRAEISLSSEDMKPDGTIIFKIITMGFTGFIMEITNSATVIVCNKTLRHLGGDLYGNLYITIMTIVTSVRSIMSVAVTGITSGAQPVLGYNYGAKKYDRVLSGIRSCALFGFAYTAVAWLLILLFPGFFISMFSSDATTNATAVGYLHIFFMAYVFMSLQFSGQSTFMALGKAPQAICFSLFRKVLLVIPLTLLLPLFLKDPVSGVFWAEPVSNIVGGSASFFTMYFTVYRKLKKDQKSLG